MILWSTSDHERLAGLPAALRAFNIHLRRDVDEVVELQSFFLGNLDVGVAGRVVDFFDLLDRLLKHQLVALSVGYKHRILLPCWHRDLESVDLGFARIKHLKSLLMLVCIR